MSSSYVLTRFGDTITIDRNFATEIAAQLQQHQIREGTILFMADEILLDPSYEFNYNNADVNFPGRYNLVLVAVERFDSQGGKINLSGFQGPNGTDGTPGDRGEGTFQDPLDEIDEEKASGKFGTPGLPPDRAGGDGMSFKILCDQLVNLDVISNGGAGGAGGTGGRGGDGGWHKRNLDGPIGKVIGSAASGRTAGDGADGGKGGNIEVYCNRLIKLGISSIGGTGGTGGTGGESGTDMVGMTGGRGGTGGPAGESGIILVKCDELGNLNISAGGAGGIGGTGGKGGGSAAARGVGGRGGRGGKGGKGGNGAGLKILHNKMAGPTALISKGGERGKGGAGGGGGIGHGTGSIGDRGEDGDEGIDRVPELGPLQLTFQELWEKVKAELNIPG